jgi:endonuclease YncB( thermonuclease family)
MTMYGPYPGVLRSWIDGDTARVDLDLGFALYLHATDLEGKPVMSARIYGINSPEMNTLEGKAAKLYAEGICPPGTRITVLSHGWDKYGGRFDASITLPGGQDFATLMLAAGHAVPYR